MACMGLAGHGMVLASLVFLRGIDDMAGPPGAGWLHAGLETAGLVMNLGALLAWGLATGSPDRSRQAGTLLALVNLVLVSIDRVVLEPDPMRAFISLVSLPALAAIARLYARTAWPALAGMLFLCLSWIFRFAMDPLEAPGPENFPWMAGSGAGFILVAALLYLLSWMTDHLYRSSCEGARKLADLAYRDQDSGMPNNRALEETLEKEASAAGTESLLILVGLKLEGLGRLNARLGYEETNLWLREFSRDMKSTLDQWLSGRTDYMSALAPNLFRIETGVFLLPLARSQKPFPGTVSMAGELQELVREVLRRRDPGEGLGFYGAWANYPRDTHDTRTLRQTVLDMLHRSDTLDRFRFIPFNAAEFAGYIRTSEVRGHVMSLSFPDELHTVFQPKMDRDRRTCTGFEALVRWTNTVMGPVAPDEFIPITEQTSTILPVSQRVLEDTIAFLGRLGAAGAGPPFRVSMNLSPVLLGDPWMDSLIHRVEASGLGPMLELELTEGVLMRTAGKPSEHLDRLRELGVRFSIDDFGTGYSNLAYLQDFPADVIKIDRRFVKDLPGNGKSASLVSAILQMGRSFGLQCVAEGVETEEQAAFLDASGCNQFQGFLFARPLEVSEALEFFLARHPPKKGATP